MRPEAPSIVDLMREEVPKTRSWIEPKIVPHSGIFVCAADPKLGKSLFAMEMARAIATGGVPFGCPHMSVPESARVLLLDYELGKEGMQERAKKSMKNEEWELLHQNFRYISKDTDAYELSEMTFSDPGGYKKLAEAVERNQPNVLIIDTLRRALGTLDESSNQDMGLVTQRLDKLVREFKSLHLSIIINHHNRKKPGAQYRQGWDPLDPDNMSGAGRLFGDPDALFMLAWDEQKKFNRHGGSYWEVRGRLKLRHGEDPGDMWFSVNEDDDLRVKYSGSAAEDKPKPIPQQRKLEPIRGEQRTLIEEPPASGKAGFRAV